MAPPTSRIRSGHTAALPDSFDPGAVLNALADPVFVVDSGGCFGAVNTAAEQFFATSAPALVGRALTDIIPGDSPLHSLIVQARENAGTVSQYGVSIESPRFGTRQVSIDVSAVPEMPGSVAVVFQERSIAQKLDNQLTHRHAARSVTAMAAMLAHEVKNPLSGIRGAAQLLEQTASDADRALTQLVRDEADRILDLVGRMDMFADDRPISRDPVNIHEVLEHVRRVAEAGVAHGLRIRESYDPSLPPVLGNRDLLVQVLLNLVKNAAEAVSAGEGEIHLSTRYQQGVRLAVPGGGSRVDLPLVVSVSDNGSGIPEDMRAHLFDPFVTTKGGGSGLGLALVAKIVGDHGGVIEFDSGPRGTTFHVMLPKADGDAATPRTEPAA
jgi:two-component system nitrogen regulation sensor histidine kinase GlnL